MTDRNRQQKTRYQLYGWVLFILCAVFFIASSLKNADYLGLVASIIFLIACFVFIIPLLKGSRKDHVDRRFE